MRLPALPRRRALRYAIVLVIAGGLAAGTLTVLSGIYNVAASVEHFYITDRVIKLALWRSIENHSSGIEAPPLDDPELVALGARHFATGCEPCHAGPGLRQSPIAAGMYPAAPRLGDRVGGWDDAELFWIVRHGLKFTGMPQWAGEGRTEEVWPLVAFLRELPGLSPEEYAKLAADPAGADGFEFAPQSEMSVAFCARCHGDATRGPISELVPALQGQNAAYLERALEEYAEDRRQSGMMEPLAVALSPAEREALVRAYAAMPPFEPTPQDPPDETQLAEGRRIATEGLRAQNVAACLSCHDGRRSDQFPRLAGLSQVYIADQLRLFREGVRGDTPYGAIMQTVADQLTDRQIESVAAYLASREAGAVETTQSGAEP